MKIYKNKKDNAIPGMDFYSVFKENGGPEVRLSKPVKNRILDDTVKKTGLKQAYVQNGKNVQNSRHMCKTFSKMILVAAVIIILTATVVAHESVISLFRSFFGDSSSVVSKYNKEINASADCNGIKFTVESILRDEFGMYLFYKITKNNGDFEGDFVGTISKVQANYEPYIRTATLSSTSSKFGGRLDGTSANEYRGLWYHPDPDFDNSLTRVKSVEINISQVFEAGSDNEILNKTDGEWHVKFNLPADKAPCNVIKPYQIISLHQTDWYVTEMRITPLSVQMLIKTKDQKTPEDPIVREYPFIRVCIKKGDSIDGNPFNYSSSMLNGYYNSKYSFWFNKAFDFGDIKEILISDKKDFSENCISIDPADYESTIEKW